MALEFCSENGGGVVSSSPRISFSRDFCHSDTVPSSNSSGLKSSSMDFDFCVGFESLDQESSSADELFSGGKILPGEIKKKNSLAKQMDPSLSLSHNPPLPLPSPSRKDNNNHNNKEVCRKDSANDEADEKPYSKSFWGFKRSSSCGSVYRRSLCPLPPLLSRSNSTGSTPTAKGSSLPKEGHNCNYHSAKQSSLKYGSSTKSSQSLGSACNYQKPPLKKGYGAYGNGVSVRVNPVLNVPFANLFGLSNIFSSTKDKRKK